MLTRSVALLVALGVGSSGCASVRLSPVAPQEVENAAAMTGRSAVALYLASGILCAAGTFLVATGDGSAATNVSLFAGGVAAGFGGALFDSNSEIVHRAAVDLFENQRTIAALQRPRAPAPAPENPPGEPSLTLQP